MAFEADLFFATPWFSPREVRCFLVVDYVDGNDVFLGTLF